MRVPQGKSRRELAHPCRIPSSRGGWNAGRNPRRGECTARESSTEQIFARCRELDAGTAPHKICLEWKGIPSALNSPLHTPRIPQCRPSPGATTLSPVGSRHCWGGV